MDGEIGTLLMYYMYIIMYIHNAYIQIHTCIMYTWILRYMIMYT